MMRRSALDANAKVLIDSSTKRKRSLPAAADSEAPTLAFNKKERRSEAASASDATTTPFQGKARLEQGRGSVTVTSRAPGAKNCDSARRDSDGADSDESEGLSIDVSDHISDDDDGDEDAITEDATANSNASNDGYIYHASAYHASSGGQNGDGDAAASDSRASGSISGRRGFAIKTASSSFWPGALTAATQPSTHAEPAADPGTPSAAAEGIPDALASSTLATAASAAASAAGAAAGVPADYYSDNLMCARCAKLLPNDPLLECHRPPHRRSCERCSKSHLACIPTPEAFREELTKLQDEAAAVRALSPEQRLARFPRLYADARNICNALRREPGLTSKRKPGATAAAAAAATPPRTSTPTAATATAAITPPEPIHVMLPTDTAAVEPAVSTTPASAAATAPMTTTTTTMSRRTVAASSPAMMPATPATTSAADSAILATIAAVKAPPTVTSAARPTIAPSAALPVAMELDPPPQRQLQRATETSRRRGARSRAPRRDWRDDEQSTAIVTARLLQQSVEAHRAMVDTMREQARLPAMKWGPIAGTDDDDEHSG